MEGLSAPFKGTERVQLAGGCCAEFPYKVEGGCPIHILGRITPRLNLEIERQLDGHLVMFQTCKS